MDTSISMPVMTEAALAVTPRQAAQANAATNKQAVRDNRRNILRPPHTDTTLKYF
jgi:hypothetical protein